jgi:uncharacterized protein (TIGR02598 family)
MNQRNLRSASSGFSLVEITLALGIVAFVLIAVLGLFGVGLDSNRRSVSDTVIPQIVNQVLSETRTPDLPAPGDAPLAFFYNEKGSAVPQQEAVYKVSLSTQSPGAALSDTGGRLYLIQLDIAWPGENTVVHASRLIPLP